MPTLSYPRLVSLVLFLTYLLIIVGGATRVFDAGVSCPDWPHCYGAYIPFPESKIPGGYMVNGTHFTWWQVALEWSHRSLASIIGFGLLAIIFCAFRRQKFSDMHLEFPPLLAAITLLTIQICLGGLTVLESNIHWSVVLHLGTAMLFFGSLVWLRRAVASGGVREPVTTPLATRIAVYLFPVVVLATMLIGAFVSSSHSGGVCGGLFSCGGSWAPADLGQHMHMQHRFMATATVVLSIILMILAKRTAPQLHLSAIHGHVMVWGQVILGIATLYSFEYYPDFYYPLSIAHLAWGTLVWLAALGIVLNLHYGKHGRFHGAQH
jgi:cytochrome c oxidase assembly protein subunit 15